MDIDKLIHEKKHFAELDDGDVETFLRQRKFRTEHLNIEFKRAFPEKQSGKYEIAKICKYIVGFSNEEGGLVIYGVSDGIKDTSETYPDYVHGLNKYPSLEDLSLWLKERVHPLVVSPAIRLFKVADKVVAIIKIPSGVNKPYCYCEPGAHSLTIFKKTAGGIVELSPDEVREFYRTQIIEQSKLIVQASEGEALPPITRADSPSELRLHADSVTAKLEDPGNFGIVRIYCRPVERVEIPVMDLKQFLELHRLDFSEAMRHFPSIEVFQKGVSVGYFPRTINKDVKSTLRISLYRDGFAAFDGLVDMFLDGDKELHSGWLCYELQRHLQLTKAVLKKTNAANIQLELDFEHLTGFRLALLVNRLWLQHASYTGIHEPVRKKLELNSIHDYDGPKRNIVIPAVREIMEEVGRIFGLSQEPPNLWDHDGYLTYVKGMEAQR
jgi:Putative DNA-binding domain